MRAKWYLVRHGETDWNVQKRAQGSSDTLLNDKGLAQAEILGKRLASTPFTAAYGSDLARAVATGATILRGRNITLQQLPALREKSYGEWEGISNEDVRERYPDMYKQFLQDSIGFSPPGGENDFDLYTRIETATRHIRETLPDPAGNILVVGHSNALRAMLVCLLRMPVDYMWHFSLANGGISVVSDFDTGHATLDLLNDTSHLSGKDGAR